jgi:hypothetical protein
MLALVSSRGYVTLDREASQVRVAIDAAQPRRNPRARGSPAGCNQTLAVVTSDLW